MSGQAGGSSGAPAAAALAAGVRRHDPDRFLAALFAPPARRHLLLLLYAFNHELGRALTVASQPTLALIRLHWWREVVEGAQRAHDLALPLAAALACGDLHRADLLALLEAHETELEARDDGFADVASWRAWLAAGAGSLAVAAARALGAAAPETARSDGIAYGATALLRAVALDAARGWCLLPIAALGARGLTRDAVLADPAGRSVRAACVELAAALLPAPRRISGPEIAATLPIVLARRDLRRGLPAPAPRGVVDRLAVAAAYARRRA